jgi:hypothetical protein
MNPTYTKTAVAALFLISIAATTPAQTPSTPEPNSTTSPPTPALDEDAAKSKLQDEGYNDIRGLASNPDGSVSGKATRDRSERNVTVDSNGNIKSR